jgi:LemA protein
VRGALPVLIAVTLVVVVAVWAVGSLNALTGLQQLLGQAWRQVDDELGRRHALTPPLVHVVKSFAPDVAPAAGAVLTALAAAARAAISVPGRGPAVSVAQRVAAESALTDALDHLFRLADGHPRLGTDQDFLGLQQELRETEERIAVAGRHYNDAARSLNTRAEQLPSSLVARLFRIGPADPFDGRSPVDVGHHLSWSDRH